MTARFLEHAASSVVRVGGGRGFVIQHGWQRYIITTAHCLPHLPPAHPASYLEERTYSNVLGPLNDDLSITAECVFADSVADVAVLGSPDDQVLDDEAEAFDSFVDAFGKIRIADGAPRTAWLLSLDGKWFRSPVSHGARWVGASGEVSGMSGSPIVTRGGAIAIVSTNALNPRLASCLPGWLLKEHRAVVMSVYVVEINGRGIIAFNAGSAAEAEMFTEDESFRADLSVLESDGRPVWDDEAE
ncbi:MAG: hypothetical protein GEU91_20005, partial [Rhizobiales bacterium]|nr:hypothetical protein [Hyphomicrobiales bacterium]